MRLEFEYTAVDLREAMMTAQIAASKPGRARFVLLGIYMAGVFVYCEILSRVAQSHNDSRVLAFVILPLIPLGLMLLAFAVGVYIQVSAKAPMPWQARARKASPATSRWRRRGQFVKTTIILGCVCALPFLTERLFANVPDLAGFMDGAFAVLAVACLFNLWAQVTNQIRARARGAWESLKHLHGPFRIDIDDQNLLISSAQWSSRFRWTAFQGFTETPNLIVLYLSRTTFHMLPKRAITSPADLNELSRILVQYVQHGHLFPRPSAFPVSPIPAIPVETVSASQI